MVIMTIMPVVLRALLHCQPVRLDEDAILAGAGRGILAVGGQEAQEVDPLP